MFEIISDSELSDAYSDVSVNRGFTLTLVQPIVQPNVWPVAQSIVQPIVQSIVQPDVQPDVQPIVQSYAQSTARPVATNVGRTRRTVVRVNYSLSQRFLVKSIKKVCS